ncbi:DUF4238 domain-containing protein [uncultured Pedobacter sp.]|uniref:DUF4238 domain-containing protein n=1 Tax=uncultured Pedobacter sp. TaxID=246139 RepID=UPI0025DB1232|nr:DUF4238 domain-containing protein [uncultured Pedobacter sp.]
MAGKKDFVFKDSAESKLLTRDNHYVPQWYQKEFIQDGAKLYYLDLSPDEIKLPDGTIKHHNDLKMLPPSKCFFEYDLYTTFFGPFISDLIERRLFGEIDGVGMKAIKTLVDGDEIDRHHYFLNVFRYLDAQKTRTPKGLSWLKQQYEGLDQITLMAELQAIQQMNCTMWLEGTREIVSAEASDTKFIISDHPVTIYNYSCPPDSSDDPQVAFKASQTIFALDENNCLILTNLEFAEDPGLKDPMNKRTNARNFGNTMVNTREFLRDRRLTEHQVREINYVIKQRARRYVAAARKEWLYPEQDENIKWENIRETLLPPSDKVYRFGGEMFMGTKDGKVHYQDAYGRTADISYLNKEVPKVKIRANWLCPCGQGNKYKNCCRDKQPSKRPSWEVFSVRERNLIFQAEINEILGFNKGKQWNDIRRTLSSEQVREIHLLYGSLWPSQTDILALLPKSDGKLRAVYSGVIDVRSITKYITTATLYFDEVIIQHPFINPNNLKSEYSPVENPAGFRQQTLTNLALFMALEDFIQAGKVNLVPDPGLFNHHLLFGSIDSATARRSAITHINEHDFKTLGDLMQDDYERMVYSLSPAQKRAHIEDKFPDASEKLINQLIERLEEKRLADPLALLQDDLFGNGGQISINTLAPNFEMTLFLAQITGALILTESQTRWEEFLSAQYPDGELTATKWKVLIDGIAGLNFPFDQGAASAHFLWREGSFGKMRTAWQALYDNVFNDCGVDVSSASQLLLDSLNMACENAVKEIGQAAHKYAELDHGQYGFYAQFNCIIPEGGIVNRQVQRFLLTSGLDEYAKKVPMAILLRPKKSN